LACVARKSVPEEETMVEKEAVTPAEGAALICVGRRRFKGLLDAGEIPHVRLGPRTVRIPLAALRAWLRRQSAQKGPEAA